MHTRIHTHIHTCTHRHIHTTILSMHIPSTHTHLCTHAHIRTLIHKYTRIPKYIHTGTHIHKLTYTLTHTYTCIHTRIHTHTHVMYTIIFMHIHLPLPGRPTRFPAPSVYQTGCTCAVCWILAVSARSFALTTTLPKVGHF